MRGPRPVRQVQELRRARAGGQGDGAGSLSRVIGDGAGATGEANDPAIAQRSGRAEDPAAGLEAGGRGAGGHGGFDLGG